MAIFSDVPKGYNSRINSTAKSWFRRISGFDVNPTERAMRNIDAALPEVGAMIRGLKPQHGVVPCEVPMRPNLRPKAPIGYDPGVKGLQYKRNPFLPR